MELEMELMELKMEHGDDLIVTPFAQLLASLKNVRNNLIAIANLPINDERHRPITKRPPLHSVPLPDEVTQCAQETLDELDWCLDQLETIQTHRSVSEMASSKFRKMLNKELSHFAESSKSGTQVSQFLINTYMDREDEDPQLSMVEVRFSSSSLKFSIHDSYVTHASSSTPSTSTTSETSQMSLLGKAKTAAMSRISGVRKLRSTYGGQIPEFGVEGQRELAVHMQRLDEWGPNVFKINELSKGHSLTAITYTILKVSADFQPVFKCCDLPLRRGSLIFESHCTQILLLLIAKLFDR
uniref:3',5'-cyclic-AMP phosphodiesterase n=1 Tax=Ascaris lumbricoides TaxID=6252 RepID=A0A9J2PTI9_ASCLU